MNKSTCDLCDEHEAIICVADPIFSSFGGRKQFGGAIETIKCHEDNSLVREIVASPGRGKVLVVDGGGSRRRSLFGDQLAARALTSGWEGVIIFGAVRDVDELAKLNIGIQALGAVPLKTEKRGLGNRNVTVRFAGVNFIPGQFVYADHNGIIVAPHVLE